MNRIGMLSRLVLIALLAASAAPARADGVRDILVDPAVGLVIDQPGSYRLTGDVTMTAAVTCITITTGDVTLDLNGHVLDGGGVAVGANIRGILGTFGSSAVTVRNGIVRGFGSGGVILVGDHSLVEGVNSTSNGKSATSTVSGISVGAFSGVRDCVALNNDAPSEAAGIRLGAHCRAENNRCVGNDSSSGRAFGIFSPDGECIIVGNICNDNTSGADSATGIGAIGGPGGTGGGGLIENNVCSGNGCNGQAVTDTASGINATGSTLGTVIRNNTCVGNGNGGAGDAVGIMASDHCTVEGNLCENNSVATANGRAAYGILAGAGCTIRTNTCGQNTTLGNGASVGIDAGIGSEIVENTCRGASAAQNGLGAGIDASTDCRVVGNTCSGNIASGGNAAGINASVGCRIEGNLCSGNLKVGSGSGASAGIIASSTCDLIGNICRGNNNSGTGIATGISAGAGCSIERNQCSSNRESDAFNSTCSGINAANDCRIVGNLCRQNSGNAGTEGNGTGVGILATSGCQIEGNTCSDNDGAGTGFAYGIATTSNRNRITGNHCNGQSGGAASYGIIVQNTDCHIADNTTGSNTTAGILLDVAAGGNRCELNRTSDTTGIINDGGVNNSMGTGDLANIAY